MLTSAISSQIPSPSVFPLISETKFHTRTKLQDNGHCSTLSSCKKLIVLCWDGGLALSLHLASGGRLLASSASGAVTLLTCSEDGVNNRSLGMPCSDCTRSRDNFVASLSITLYISRRRDREGALISAVVWVETQVITFQSACPE